MVVNFKEVSTDRMNRWEQKQEKRIRRLLERPYESLSVGEKLEILSDKLSKCPRIRRISYEEFALACLENWELDFGYRGVDYEVVLGGGDKVIFFVDIKYKDGQCTWSKEEHYSNAAEMLEKVRIDGKTIKEIWDDVIS